MVSEPDVPAHVTSFLADRSALTLATASPSGVPHAASFLYVDDELALYFWTRAGTVTTRHVEANPVVAFTVDGDTQDWTSIKGVQGHGDCTPLTDGGERARVVELFQRKFPGLEGATPSDVRFFRISPSELHFIDSERTPDEEADEPGFGVDFHRETILNVFLDLPVEEADALAGKMSTRTVDEGEVIVRQGDAADRFFIIVDGEVEVVREDHGKEQRLDTLSAGHFFGEIAILRDTPRTATVRALSPTTLLAMDRGTFTGLVADSLATTNDLEWIIRQRHAGIVRATSAPDAESSPE